MRPHQVKQLRARAPSNTRQSCSSRQTGVGAEASQDSQLWWVRWELHAGIPERISQALQHLNKQLFCEQRIHEAWLPGALSLVWIL